MEYPDHKTYGELYSRYFEGRDIAELLQLLEPLQGMNVADLCGGEGRATIAALERGAEHVTLVDAESKMIPPELRAHSRISVRVAKVELTFLLLPHTSLDRVVCRQAVNYWLNDETVKSLADAMKPGGIFAFNTFNEEPPLKPRKLQYERNGYLFVELSWLVGDVVHHVQIREGMAPHCTSFKWLPRELLHEILEPHFTIVEDRREKTSLYRCVKK